MKRPSVTATALLLAAVAGLGGWFAVGGDASASADVWHGRSAGGDARFVAMLDRCTYVDTWVSAWSWVDQVPPAKPTEGSGLWV